MNRLHSGVASAVALLALSATLSAQPVYSVDLGTKHLVRIDTATAAVTDIGVLPAFNGTVLDLEFVGNRLYALANVSPNKVLMELDASTGDILSSTIITVDGVPLTAVSEGLGAGEKGALFISYDNSGMVGASNSNNVGFLGVDGVVLDPRNVGRDCDGMAARFIGRLWGIDRDTTAMRNVIFTISHELSGTTHINDIPFSGTINGIDELTQTRAGLFALDFITKRLHRLDPIDATPTSSMPYDPAYTFVAIAAPPACSGDADGDGDRDFADITAVLTGFGLPNYPFGPGDADGDGDADFADVTEVLALFALPCYP